MSRKLTTEEIKERIYSLEGDNYKLLSEYVDARTKIRVKHSLCGCVYETLWGNFQRGKRCPKCAMLARKNKLAFTNEDIVKRMHNLVGNEYTKMDENYINANTKFKIRHNVCGFEYEIAWGTFQNGVRCPKCAGRYRYTDSEISELISEMTNGEYTKLSTYKNAHTKFKIKHESCGFEYMVCWSKFQTGRRCPKCNQPRGEKFIQDYLTNQDVSFATQVRFGDCRFKYPLPFDFGILNKDNNKIIALIEFDGRQHYEPVERFGGEEALKEVQLRDAIKNEYCAKNKIPLLRIKYDEDIEEKLSLFLTQERVKV